MHQVLPLPANDIIQIITAELEGARRRELLSSKHKVTPSQIDSLKEIIRESKLDAFDILMIVVDEFKWNERMYDTKSIDGLQKIAQDIAEAYAMLERDEGESIVPMIKPHKLSLRAQKRDKHYKIAQNWNGRDSLTGFDLSYRDLSGLDLSKAKLQHANLSFCNLNDTYLRNANLNWADLTGASLRAANFYGAAILYASLRSASLQGADMRANLSSSDLSGALYDKSTLWKENFEIPSTLIETI